MLWPCSPFLTSSCRCMFWPLSWNSQADTGSCRPPLSLSFFLVASQPSKKLCQRESGSQWKRESPRLSAPLPMRGMTKAGRGWDTIRARCMPREGKNEPKGGQSSQRLRYRTLSLNWEERKEQTIKIKVEIKSKWRECWFPDEGGWNPIR